MHKIILIILFVFLAIDCSFAQPAVAWMRMYDNGRQEVFHDIYSVSDGSYIMCGSSGNDDHHSPPEGGEIWVVKTDIDGNVQWSETYHQGRNVQAYSLIETDDGDFMITGRFENNVFALRISAEGEETWFETYNGIISYAVIELKSGEFVLSGIAQNRNAYLLCIDGLGNVIWEEDYDAGDRFSCFYSMREAQGGIVAAGDVARSEEDLPQPVWTAKVDFEGELIWSRFHNIFERYTYSRSIVSDVESGFIIGGSTCVNEGDDHNFFLLKINDEGEMEGVDFYDSDDDIQQDQDRCRNIARLDDGGFVMVGRYFYSMQQNISKPLAFRVRRNRNLRWMVDYPIANQGGFGDRTHEFNSVIQGHDGAIVTAGMFNFVGDGSGHNGILLKLEPEILEPMILEWSPDDTLLSVLLGDTVDFNVRAVDQQGDEMTYLWIMGEDTLSIDTTTTVIFDEMGEFEVQCQVSDGEFTTAITWHVSVLNWYIDRFQPDSTDITVRRGSCIDFTHHVRANEGFEFEYLWEHFGRGGNFQFNGEDSIRFDFDLTGDHIIRAWIMNGEESKTVGWDVNVRSILWWWWPHEFDLSAYEDTTIMFEVFSFDQDSDSVEYSWSLDNEALACDSSLVELHFPETGQYIVTAYAQEGIEADTISWTINMEERSFTADDADYADLPSTPMLYPGIPNPFNSSVKLTMYLPKADHVSLAIFDVNGREVARLVDGDVGAGRQGFVWNASDFPAGVYVVWMEAGDVSEMRKVVLVR